MVKKITLIGTIPPPVGGVSIHIERFYQSFDSFDNIDATINVIDIKKKTVFWNGRVKIGWFDIIKCFVCSDLIHIHISNEIKLLIAIVSRLLFKKVVYTHHNSIIKNKQLFFMMCRFCHRVILVNDKNIDASIVNAINGKYVVIPAFIPPCNIVSLPETIESMLTGYDFIISSNCSKLSYVNNKEVYGFDLIVDAFIDLHKNKLINNSMLFLLDPSGTYEGAVTERLLDLKLGKNKIIYCSQQLDFSELIKKSHMSIRATRTDGDSISVRESLHLGVPIMALFPLRVGEYFNSTR